MDFQDYGGPERTGPAGPFPIKSLRDKFFGGRRAISMMQEASDERPFLLATLPPSQGQIRLALGVVAVLFAAFSVTVTVAKVQLPRIDAFIPAIEASILINDLITSALLFAQFSIMRSWALLAIASGYFFTALIVIPHTLVFPGLIAPTGLLGAGPQSAAWLYVIWHLGLPLAVIVYALLKDADRAKYVSKGTPRAAIALSMTAALVLVCGLTWIATEQEMHLPKLLDHDSRLTRFGLFANGFLLFLGALALVLLWVRRRSVLDIWIMVVIFAFLIEILLSAQLAGSRFSVGYYAGRIYSFITATIVLIVLLSDITTLHANLARSVMRQRGARQARQIAMDVMAASIAHEINQPLAAIVANADAGLRWLTRPTPDLDRTRASLNYIVADGHRAKEVVTGIRSMFQKGAHGRILLDVNDLVREVVKMVDGDLRVQRVSVETELRVGLPQLVADRGQLQQVFLNLIANSIEAMDSITSRARVLRLSSDIFQEMRGVVVTVEDAGMGISSDDKDRIFEPFFTTKSAGTGIGLSICRSIIESHGGSLRASANRPHGTIFHVTLPSGDL
jgi:signal transduction histidine kinase